MPDKKQSEFKVSDRRLFTSDGELRSSGDNEAEQPAQPEAVSSRPAQSAVAESPTQPAFGGSSTPSAATETAATASETAPPPPTASEQQAQHDAYRESARNLDRRVELSGHSAKELEVSFERFLASLYMTAMLQLGLMHEQGAQPGVDIIGARQTIDTLGMLAEKTKGNLTPKEQAFLENCLYELRMAYVEVTNAIARGAQTKDPGTGTNG